MDKKIKYVRKYAKIFLKTMKEIGREDNETMHETFKIRYMNHLNSKEFIEFSKYKTISLEKVYCAITFAQILTEAGYSLDGAQEIWEKVLIKELKKKINNILKFIDNLPFCYKIVSGLLYKDAKERIAENCLTYEFLEYNKDKLEYKISRCAYIEIFEYYGIRQFCKVFCNNDLCMKTLYKRAKFIRHSDLVDGENCHDEIIKIKRGKRL